jgi:drug/metabolite transporter (DMT)-like permease
MTELQKALVRMFIAMFCFSIMNVFLKFTEAIPVWDMVFYRCLFSGTVAYYIIQKRGLNWRGHSRIRLGLRGLFGTCALITFFLTLRNMPLASAVTIQYLSPIFTTIFAVFLLKEKVRSQQWFFFFISFLGIVWLKGFNLNITWTWFFVAVSSAAFSGLAYNMVRSMKDKEEPMVVVLHFQLVGLLLGGLISFLFSWKNGWKIPDWKEWVLIFFVGLFSHLGQVFLTKSLQGGKVAAVTSVNFLGAVLAMVFGYFIFKEIVSLQDLFAISIVLLGVGGNLWVSKP